MGTKTINFVVTDGEFERLKDAKGDRTWPEAVKEEFGVSND
jgi:hypothetical protein